MKKLLSFLVLFSIGITSVFGDFQIKTNIIQTRQDAIKKEVDKIYPKFQQNLLKLSKEKQLTTIESVTENIDNILTKNQTELNTFILSYLNYLLKEDYNSITSGNTETQGNSTVCMTGYTEVNGNCVKLAVDGCGTGKHYEGSMCVENQKTCEITNGKGFFNWNGFSWSKCEDITCDLGYEYKYEQCIPKTHPNIGDVDEYVDSNVIVPGAKDKLIISFTLKASDVANIKISSIKPTQVGYGVASNTVTNYRLYQDGVLLKTSNTLSFTGLNSTIYKNQSSEFKIIADFNSSISTSGTYGITILANTGIEARNSSNNNIVPVNYDINSTIFNFSKGGSLEISKNSSQPLPTLLTPGYNDNSVLKFDIRPSNDNIYLTDVYITNVARNTTNLSDVLRASTLSIGGNIYTGDTISTDVIHFPLGTNGISIKRDELTTGEVRVSFNDSSSKSNTPFQFALSDSNPGTSITNGTYHSIRAISESTGLEIERTGGEIKGNEFLYVRSKINVKMESFTPSTTDLYKFTITTDASRRVNLDKIVFYTSGTSNLNGATITIYRDSNGTASNSLGSKVISGNNTEIDIANGQASNELSAGSTTIFYAQITGANASSGSRREVRISGLSYKNDVSSTQNAIWIDSYNLGVPTDTNTYTY